MQYLSKGNYKELERASIDVLRRLSQFLDINTIFIAKNDKKQVEIMHSFNREYVIIEEGFKTEFSDSYWQFIVDNDRESLIIEDLSKDDLTKDMSVTKSIGGGTLLGVPISYGDGSNYGTLCAIDNKPRKFNEVEVQLFQTMATLLGYVIDLDEAKNHIQSFSTPMVPIDEGVVILPLVGEMDEVRSKVILEQVLAKSYQESIDYFIIDISGLVIDNGLVSENIFKLTQSLKLLGALPILTGVRPDQAMNFQKSGSEMLQLTSKTSLKEALKWIGYRLVRS